MRTGACAPRRHELEGAFDALVDFDTLHARARTARLWDATPPRVDALAPSPLVLQGARHPLLVEAREGPVIPYDLALGEGERAAALDCVLVHRDDGAEAVERVRANVALVRVEGGQRERATRVRRLDALALDDAPPVRERGEDEVQDRVVHEVELVEVEDAAVGARTSKAGSVAATASQLSPPQSLLRVTSVRIPGRAALSCRACAACENWASDATAFVLLS